MTSLSWKPLSLLGVMLMVAIGLQAGAIKIMTSLSQPDQPVTETSSADHAKPPAHSSKPEVMVADPPHLAELHDKPAPAHTPEQIPEHALEQAPTPESHSAPVVEPAPMPAPAHASMPMSNIPPPIELDPEPSAETPAPAPHGTPTASIEAATLASRIPPPIELETETPASALLEPSWLEARDSNHYTVQLYSGKDLSRLREIAASESISMDAPKAYFTTASRSGPWYSLVVGDYPDFKAAQDTATQIATQSGSIKPWIRRFSEIQARMR
ncbi:MAG: SPOR domain-containing protein [Gammaproteobacteria bacterium]|nr:SPOR domain-containing protein [Gammaproteobacteria bacterium]MCP5195464.1 SPOR domain-containing protein [Gammaproteobacteria bacterium]